MNRKNNSQHQFSPMHLFYCIFSIAFIITWFFPYYEVCTIGWGLPCNNWNSITGFSFIINNSLAITGIFGVLLEIISPYLFYIAKIREALILVTLGNIIIGVNIFYLSVITKQSSLPGLYDIYFLFNLKSAYIIVMFAWSIMCGMNLTQIIIEIEKKYYM
ncbi:MAG: hypothetical protein ACFFBV_04255 [Promethearchaeota archaeon]